MSTFRRFNRVQVDVLQRRTRMLASVTAGVLAAIVGSRNAQAASANWNATATDGNWEATGTENNWSSGVAAFPRHTHRQAQPRALTLRHSMPFPTLQPFQSIRRRPTQIH